MTPIEVIRVAYVGKTVSNAVFGINRVGWVIRDVSCHCFEAGLFVFELVNPMKKKRATFTCVTADTIVEAK